MENNQINSLFNVPCCEVISNNEINTNSPLYSDVFSSPNESFFNSNKKRLLSLEESYVFCKTDCQNIVKTLKKWIKRKKIFESKELVIEAIQKKCLPNCKQEFLSAHLKACTTQVKCHRFFQAAIHRLLPRPPSLNDPSKEISGYQEINYNQIWSIEDCELIEIHVASMDLNEIKVPCLNSFVGELYNNRILSRPFFSIAEHLEGDNACTFCVKLLNSVLM